jgi:hypothetical protein
MEGAIPASMSASVKLMAVYGLRTGVGVEDQAFGGEAGVGPSAGEQCLLEGGHDQRRGLRAGDPPAQDPS